MSNKYRILAPIYFDGVLFPADTIVDVSVIPISGECLVLRSWGEPYHGDRPAITSVEQLRTPEPVPVPDPEVSVPKSEVSAPASETSEPESDVSVAPTEPPVQPEPAPEPTPAPPPKRSRKSAAK